MPARLFRRIQSSFSPVNKKLLVSLALFIAGVFFIGGTVLADNSAALNTTYGPWINLFSQTSGITSVALQSSTSNNSAAGLVLSLNLNIQPQTGEDLKTAWGRIASNAGVDTFVAKLCNNNSTQCWLSLLPYSGTTPDGGNISQKSSQGNYSSSQTLAVSAFSSNAGYTSSLNNANTTTMAPGAISSATTTTNFTSGGQLYTYDSTTGTVAQIPNLILPQGSSLTVSMWYCAGGAGATAADAYKTGGAINNMVTKFGNLCSGTSYFEIGSPQPVTIPSTAAGVQQQVQAGQQALATKPVVNSSEDDNLPQCGVLPGGTGTINGCVAQVAYFIYYLCATVAGFLGQLFDFFIGYSLSDASYRYPFAVTGWQLVRDISNIFFILIMVWTGFSAVINTEKTNMKKVVAALIINAFLINFSLFFTRVIIDISNISARIFYNQMTVCQQSTIKSDGTCATQITGTGGFPSLSTKIVSSFNPQKIFSPNILNNSLSSGQGGAANNFSATQAGNTALVTTPRDYANYFAIICIVAAALMVFIGIMFFKVTFLFLGRVVGLYIAMIFSPFAFLSYNLPLFNKVKSLKWDDWISDLTNYAMLAPVFVFFLYIIYILLNSNFVQQIGLVASQSSSWFAVILSVTIPLLIIYSLLQAAQKAATSLSGEIGKNIQKFGEQLTGAAAGVALGVATGGASLAGTSGAGAFKLSGEKRTQLEAKKAEGGFSGQLANLQLKASDWTQKQSFDARNTGVVKNISKQFGIDANNSLVSRLGFSSERTKGGREGQIKRAEDKTKKEIDSVKSYVKNEDAAAFWNKHLQTKKMQKRLDEEAEALYFTKYKTKVTDKNSPEFQAEKQNAINAYGKVTDNKKLTQALRIKYAGTIQNENVLGLNPGRDITSMVGMDAARLKAVGAGIPLAGGVAVLPAMALAAGSRTDDIGKRNAAKAFLDAQKKIVTSKKPPRSERLEEENKTMTKELEAIEKTLEGIYKATTEAKITKDPLNTGKTKDEINKMVEQEVTRIKSKDNVLEANALIAEHRNNLKNQYDTLDLDVHAKNKDYQDTLRKNGNDENHPDVKSAQRVRDAKIAERNKKQVEYNELDSKRKRELENNINRNESELEKIADKNKATEEKKPDEKK